MKRRLQSELVKFWEAWKEFWFAPQDQINLALMRLVLGFNLAFLSLMKLWNTDLYNDSGIIPRSAALEIIPQYCRPAFAWFFWPDSLAFQVQLIQFILLVCVAIGLGQRWVGLLALVINLGFLQRNFGAIYGADAIATVFLFYLALSDSSSVFSFKARRALIPELASKKDSDMLTSVVMRLIQIHILIIYAYTGFEKLKGASWWDGTALWTVFGNLQIMLYDLTWIKHFPVLISFLTFSTILFEVYFPMAMFIPRLRPYWLFAGLLFHFGIAFLMGIFPFSIVMTSTYFLFISPETLRSRIVSIWRNLDNIFSFSKAKSLN